MSEACVHCRIVIVRDRDDRWVGALAGWVNCPKAKDHRHHPAVSDEGEQP
jgi:hypothetical protein